MSNDSKFNVTPLTATPVSNDEAVRRDNAFRGHVLSNTNRLSMLEAKHRRANAHTEMLHDRVGQLADDMEREAGNLDGLDAHLAEIDDRLYQVERDVDQAEEELESLWSLKRSGWAFRLIGFGVAVFLGKKMVDRYVDERFEDKMQELMQDPDFIQPLLRQIIEEVKSHYDSHLEDMRQIAMQEVRKSGVTSNAQEIVDLREQLHRAQRKLSTALKTMESMADMNQVSQQTIKALELETNRLSALLTDNHSRLWASLQSGETLGENQALVENLRTIVGQFDATVARFLDPTKEGYAAEA